MCVSLNIVLLKSVRLQLLRSLEGENNKYIKLNLANSPQASMICKLIYRAKG